jgi:hypothetical protein
MPYGRRTSAVRALWVVAIALGLHTDDMTDDAKATTFVTAPDGFIGRVNGGGGSACDSRSATVNVF